MRINHLKIPENTAQKKGFDAISLFLGNTVALFGKNGAGKTRFLDLLESQYFDSITINDFKTGKILFPPDEIEEYINTRPLVAKLEDELQKKITDLEANQKRYSKAIGAASSQVKLNSIRKELVDLKSATHPDRVHIQNLKSDLYLTEEIVRKHVRKYLRRIKQEDIKQLQTVIDTDNSGFVSFEQLIDKFDTPNLYNEINSINKTALRYLTKLPNQLALEWYRSVGNRTDFENTVVYKRFSSLKNLVSLFLDKELLWKHENVSEEVTTDSFLARSRGYWILDDREFDYNDFSDGEKILFAYSLMFFLLEQNPDIDIRECIIIIDEPELHLHPKMEIDLINKIKSIINEKGQLIIATHSINLLSALSYDEIFMVEKSKIISPGRTTPYQSLNQLLGIEGQIEILEEFLTSISNWAFINFINQCFNAPDVLQAAKANDPEVEVFIRAIQTAGGENVLLDFGAGKGRLYKELTKRDLMGNLAYCALEIDDKNAAHLQEIGIKTIYKEYMDLPDDTFKFILLCNVLHEIPVTKWVSTLTKIKDALTVDGFLVVIEDLKLPRGEKIEESGFLILDIESLGALFSMTTLPTRIYSEQERYKERILCALVEKKLIGGVDLKSVLASLSKLSANTYKRIKDLRNNGFANDLSKGRLSAFYSQLYINIKLAEEIIAKTQTSL